MSNNFITDYIHQRMAQLGHEKYSYKPVRVKSAATSFNLVASNEYYYLVSKSVDNTLKIKSDTEVLVDVSNYSDLQFFQHHEFSGFISITQAVPVDLEFIKVTVE